MIAILLNGGVGFPNGTAPTARATSYAKGLLANGMPVLVLCLGTSEASSVGIQNREIRGTNSGIQFAYTTGSTVRGATFPRRRWLQFKGYVVASWRLLTLRDQLDAIILYPETIGAALLFRLVAWLRGSAFLLEKSELPAVHLQGSPVLLKLLPLYIRTVYRLFDGIIVISDYLYQYFQPLIRRKARLLKIPILVDVSVFDTATEIQGSGGYIAYCGTLNEQKDGVVTLMRAYAAIEKRFPTVRLFLIGDSYTNSQLPAHRSIAAELGIADRVVFTGAVQRKEIPGYLIPALALVLARPSSDQAAAGFPSKLGEYLATGNPVVITRTGEIDQFLQDGVSAYFAPPDDAGAFADRLADLLSDPDKAKRIGARGKLIAMEAFDPVRNGARLIAWVREIKQSKSRFLRKKEVF